MPLALLCSSIRKQWWPCIFHWHSNFQMSYGYKQRHKLRHSLKITILWDFDANSGISDSPFYFTTKLMHLPSISCVTWNRSWSSALSLIFLVTTDFLNCGCYKGCNIFQSKVIMISSVIPWIVIISRTAGCLKALNNNRQKVVLDY